MNFFDPLQMLTTNIQYIYMCVCEREREREREWVSEYVCVCMHLHQESNKYTVIKLFLSIPSPMSYILFQKNLEFIDLNW